MIGLKQIFTWWNRNTLGTFLKTLFFGKLVGKDELGNKYYKNKKDERWVIYANDIEATKITSDWFLWMHHTINEIPSETLKKLNQPKEKLYFILGSDAAMNIKTWKNYEILPSLTNFLIALRSEDSIEKLDKNFPFNYEIILGDKLNLSSTSLRKKLKERDTKNSELPLGILNYIIDKNLY